MKQLMSLNYSIDESQTNVSSDRWAWYRRKSFMFSTTWKIAAIRRVGHYTLPFKQFGNEIMKYLANTSKENFGLMCVGMARELETQDQSTSHNHIQLLQQVGAVQNV